MMLDALAPEFRPEHAGLSPADVCELEEVDLCNETLARLELLEQEDSITRGLVRAHGPGLPRGDGRARRPAAPHDAVIGAGAGLRLGVAAQSPRSTYRSMPFAKNGAKVKHLMHKEFGRRRC